MIPSALPWKIEPMASVEPVPGAAQRNRSLRLVRSWTWAAAVGAVGLTGALALLAASSFAGHNAQNASASQQNDQSGGGNQFNGGGDQSDGGLSPQPPSSDAFGGGGQPPAVVSGGT
jgi:hypothetical protein